MKINLFLLLLVPMIFSTCNNKTGNESLISGSPDLEKIAHEIQQVLNNSVEATRNKDIEAYMDRLPEDLIIKDESGEILTRDQQKANALRDWAIIDTTLTIYCKIDSLTAYNDSAMVYTSQRWERIMFRRDGINKDTVVTTQKHRELWKKNHKGWQNYEVVELGGQIFINGQEYHQ